MDKDRLAVVVGQSEQLVCPDCKDGRDPFDPNWLCPECRQKEKAIVRV
jgi:rubredoxin